jgi:hypothetical protein
MVILMLSENFLKLPKEVRVRIFHRGVMRGWRLPKWLAQSLEECSFIGRLRLGRFGQALCHRLVHFIKERAGQLNAAAIAFT